MINLQSSHHVRLLAFLSAIAAIVMADSAAGAHRNDQIKSQPKSIFQRMRNILAKTPGDNPNEEQIMAEESIGRTAFLYGREDHDFLWDGNAANSHYLHENEKEEHYYVEATVRITEENEEDVMREINRRSNLQTRQLQEECTRTVNFIIEQSGTSDYKMKITSEATGNSTLITENSIDAYDETHEDSTRKFVALLPSLNPPNDAYSITFLDGNNKVVWPTFVQEMWDPVPSSSCADLASPENVHVVKPKVARSDCNEIIVNGGQAMYYDTSIEPWHHTGSGVAVDYSNGIDGSGEP